MPCRHGTASRYFALGPIHCDDASACYNRECKQINLRLEIENIIYVKLYRDKCFGSLTIVKYVKVTSALSLDVRRVLIIKLLVVYKVEHTRFNRMQSFGKNLGGIYSWNFCILTVISRAQGRMKR